MNINCITTITASRIAVDSAIFLNKVFFKDYIISLVFILYISGKHFIIFYIFYKVVFNRKMSHLNK